MPKHPTPVGYCKDKRYVLHGKNSSKLAYVTISQRNSGASTNCEGWLHTACAWQPLWVIGTHCLCRTKVFTLPPWSECTLLGLCLDTQTVLGLCSDLFGWESCQIGMSSLSGVWADSHLYSARTVWIAYVVYWKMGCYYRDWTLIVTWVNIFRAAI